MMKSRTWKTWALSCAGVLVLTLAVIFSVNAIQHTRKVEAARNWISRNGFTVSDIKDGISFTPVQEPWIALRWELGEDTGWRVIDCSDSGMPETAAELKTLILCQDYYGISADYNVSINGTKTSTVNIASDGVEIRVIDLASGMQSGETKVMKPKSLPEKKSNTSSLSYSDTEVTRTVRKLINAGVCSGYDESRWNYSAKDGSLTISDSDSIANYIFAVPDHVTSLRKLSVLSKKTKALYLPRSVTEIAEGVLEPFWFVIAEPDSYALKYAREHRIPYLENTGTVLHAPSDVNEWNWYDKNTREGSSILDTLLKATGIKALQFPANTAPGEDFPSLNGRDLTVLVERDSPAERYFRSKVGNEKEYCAYTYTETWYGESTGYAPDRWETVVLGHFEQDGNSENGPEPIDWIVLDNDGETALLISKYILINTHVDGKRFSDFMDRAFTGEEMAILCGDSVEDKIFLPSIRDVQGFFLSNRQRQTNYTPALSGGSGWWQVRDENAEDGNDLNDGTGWECRGTISAAGQTWAIRPAVRIRISEYSSYAEQLNAAYYAEGAAKRDIGDWEGAADAFSRAGDYADAAEQVNETRYRHAIELAAGGDYRGAASVFMSIKGYKDVDDLLKTDQNLSAAAAAVRDDAFQPGKYVTFGHYRQSADSQDQTPVEWLVLARDGQNALLLSRYGLETKAYNDSREDTTWERCTLRAWLNGSFLESAFTAEEQNAVLLTDVDNSISQYYTQKYTNVGNNTKDKVFLLSYAEANLFLDVAWDNNTNYKARAALTAYAAEGPHDYQSFKTEENKYANAWWLRSPGSSRYDVEDVYTNGSIRHDSGNDDEIAVRPAVWINLDAH